VGGAGEIVPEATRAFAAPHETHVDAPPTRDGTQTGYKPERRTAPPRAESPDRQDPGADMPRVFDGPEAG
jgi:hypothetical protein